MNDFLVLIISASFGAGLYAIIKADQKTSRLYSGWLLLAMAFVSLFLLCWRGTTNMPESAVFSGLWGAVWLLLAAGSLFCGVKCVLAVDLIDNLIWSAGLSGTLAALMVFAGGWIPGIALMAISLTILMFCLPGRISHQELEKTNITGKDWHEVFLSVLAGVLFVFCGLTSILHTTQNGASNSSSLRQTLPRQSLIESVRQQAADRLLDQPGQQLPSAWLQPTLLVRITSVCVLIAVVLMVCIWLHQTGGTDMQWESSSMTSAKQDE